MKKDVVIVANFCGEFNSANNGRFKNIANMLSEECDIEIITSDFRHGTKTPKTDFSVDGNFKATFIHEPHYPKNICIKRFFAHYIFSKNVRKYLEQRKVPDLLYCAVPSLDAAFEVAKYAKKKKINFILDIQDLWPEAFRMVFDIPVVSDIIYGPMMRKANKIYSAADEVVAVSKTYADRAMIVNKKCKTPIVAFLGTDLDKVDIEIKNPLIVQKEGNEIFMAYIGTLGNSYDLISVLSAMKLLKEEGRAKELKFIVMGSGQLKEKFEEFARENELNAVFTGKLPYPQMIAELAYCDFAVNPIKAKSAGSIINKVGDYAAVGIPVVNTQNCEEYRNLIDEYGAGINCENGNIRDLADAIEKMHDDAELRVRMGKANRRLAEDKFNRSTSYKKICELILK